MEVVELSPFSSTRIDLFTPLIPFLDRSKETPYIGNEKHTVMRQKPDVFFEHESQLACQHNFLLLRLKSGVRCSARSEAECTLLLFL